MKTLPGYGMLFCAASEDDPSLVSNLLYLLHGLHTPFTQDRTGVSQWGTSCAALKC